MSDQKMSAERIDALLELLREAFAKAKQAAIQFTQTHYGGVHMSHYAYIALESQFKASFDALRSTAVRLWRAQTGNWHLILSLSDMWNYMATLHINQEVQESATIDILRRLALKHPNASAWKGVVDPHNVMHLPYYYVQRDSHTYEDDMRTLDEQSIRMLLAYIALQGEPRGSWMHTLGEELEAHGRAQYPNMFADEDDAKWLASYAQTNAVDDLTEYVSADVVHSIIHPYLSADLRVEAKPVWTRMQVLDELASIMQNLQAKSHLDNLAALRSLATELHRIRQPDAVQAHRLLEEVIRDLAKHSPPINYAKLMHITKMLTQAPSNPVTQAAAAATRANAAIAHIDRLLLTRTLP